MHVGRVPERRYHRSPSPQTGFCRPLHRINSRRGIHDQGRNTHNFSGHRQEVPRSGKVSLVKLQGKILIIDTSNFPYGCKKGQSATIFLLNRAPCNDVAFCFLVEKRTNSGLCGIAEVLIFPNFDDQRRTNRMHSTDTSTVLLVTLCCGKTLPTEPSCKRQMFPRL